MARSSSSNNTVKYFAGSAAVVVAAFCIGYFVIGGSRHQPTDPENVEVERLKTTLILTGSLLMAATVAFAGIIGLVGLMVPHTARRLAGTPDHRSVLPGRILPVGLVTAFLGAPFFLYLRRRQSRHG